MATTISGYTSYKQYVHDGTIDLDRTGYLKIALVTSAYVFNAAHTIFDNGANNGTDPSYCELTAGAGYTTGGVVLSSLSVNSSRFDAADASWVALTKTFRGAVIYLNTTVNSVVKPLIAYILFDSTPVDIVMEGGTFVIEFHANGIITF